MPRTSSSGKGLGKWHRLGGEKEKEKSIQVIEKKRGLLGESIEEAIMVSYFIV